MAEEQNTPTPAPVAAPSPEDAKAKRAANLAKARAARAAKAAAPAPKPAPAPAPVAASKPAASVAARPAEALDPDNVTLSAERLEAIRVKAREIVAKERLAALEKMELDKALEEIRGKAGNIIGDPVEDEIVNITIDVAAHADSITINGRKFFHGQTYPVPRHQARSLMEIMYRTALHEHSITDKPLSAFYAKPRHTIISRRGAVNAPRRPGEGLPAGVN